MTNSVERQTWSTEEDQLLMSTVNTHGYENWALIASFITGRTARQCHNRWNYTINPNMNRSEWTEHEDKVILHMFEQYGKKWAKVRLYQNIL